MIAGVCGGIAEHFDWDPVWVRLATVLLVFIHGLGIIMYIAAWIIIPNNPHQKEKTNKTVNNAVKTVKKDIKAVIPTKAKTGSVKAAKKLEKALQPKRKRRGGLITLLVIFLVLVGVAVLGFVAQQIFCISGSGNIVEETRDVSNFDKVELQGSGTLIITQGENYSVTLETDDNLLPYYETRVFGDKLEIGTRNFHCFIRNSGLIVRVTLPEVEKLAILGSGDIISTNVLNAEDLKLQIAGSGDIKLEVNVTNLETEIAGSGEATYIGSATTHNIDIAGSGDIYAFDLSTEQTSVDIAGSGSAEITAYKTLDVDIAGSGDIYYKGEPVVSQSIAGSGDIVAK